MPSRDRMEHAPASEGQTGGSVMTNPGNITAAAKVARTISIRLIERAPFEGRGFRDCTIEVLAACGIDAPERLLFMTIEQCREIPGIGTVSLAEIERYRAR